MKKFIAVLMASALLFALCACSPTKKTEENIQNYLYEKYGDLEFEMISYDRDQETNGRYIVNARCVDTGVEFQIYASTLIITDSYEVEYANSVMEKKLMAIINDQNSVMHVEDILWLELYSEEASGYKFSELDGEVSYDIKELTEVYRIILSPEVKTASDAAFSIYNVIMKLYLGGVSLERVTFKFTIDNKVILFNTDTRAVRGTSRDVLESKINEAAKQSYSTNGGKDNLFYRPTSEYSVDYFSKR